MSDFDPNVTITTIRRTRLSAANALAEGLSSHVNTPFSEAELLAAWHSELKKNDQLAAEGWYVPPPTGMSVLIGKPDSFDRMRYDSLRHEATWPRDEHRFGDRHLMYAYASPFDRCSGLMGDIGVTLYNGDEPSIQSHLSTCLKVTIGIAGYAKVGMQLSELFEYGMQVITETGLSNNTFSLTDPDGLDVGHTIPFSDSGLTKEERSCLDEGAHEDICKLLSSRRHFLNRNENRRISPTMAFTVEPRLASRSLPLVSFHVLVLFCEGRKAIVSGFGRLFEVFGMDGFLPQECLSAIADGDDGADMQ